MQSIKISINEADGATTILNPGGIADERLAANGSHSAEAEGEAALGDLSFRAYIRPDAPQKGTPLWKAFREAYNALGRIEKAHRHLDAYAEAVEARKKVRALLEDTNLLRSH